MSVYGNAGGMIGWITQTLFALKTFFIDGIDDVEFEVIDDVGFKLKDTYHSCQVKNDFSNHLTHSNINDEIVKMRKKTEELKNCKLIFIISTNDLPRTELLVKTYNESFPVNNDIEFQIFEKLEEEIMMAMAPHLKHVTIDKPFVHMAASFIMEQVFETYRNTKKESKDKIILSKANFTTFLSKVTYKNVFAKLFSLESEVMESKEDVAVDKFNMFNKKFLDLYEEAEYIFMHTKYSLMRRGSIEQQLITGSFFKSQEKSSIIKYKSRTFKTTEDFKSFFNDFTNNISFIPRYHDKNVDESIRRGLLITSVEEKNGFSW